MVVMKFVVYLALILPVVKVLPLIVGIRICTVTGPSMEPTICHKDFVIAKKVSEKERFRIGEIYCFMQPPHYEGIYLVAKRLDRILPDGSLYFLGDNASNSFDSRNFGAVDPKYVKYKVVYVIHRKRHSGNPV